MAHFAQINKDTDIVEDVLVVDNADIANLPFPASEAVGISFLRPWSKGQYYWKQTSYNKNFRGNYGGIGCWYDKHNDRFLPPKPHPGWVLNEVTLQYDPPTPCPQDGKLYSWDEVTLQWVLT